MPRHGGIWLSPLFSRMMKEGSDSYVSPPQKALSCVTNADAYGLENSDSGHEIFAYHWHPESVSPVRYPHLHLERGAEIGRAELTGGHLPTGRAALEDVLTFVIEQFRVRRLRNDWRDVLVESADLFRKYRSWA
jgi:hypothetical protein